MKNIKFELLEILEWLVYIVIVAMAVKAVGIQCRWIYLQQVYPGDFIIYYNAASGNFLEGWLYANFMSIIFTPLLIWQNWVDGYLYYCGFNTVCFLFITHKMFQVKWGWIPVIIVIPYFVDLLQVGNIQIMCVLLAMFEWPALLGVLIKPQYAIFPVLHYITKRLREHKPIFAELEIAQFTYLVAIVLFVLAVWPSQQAIDFALEQGNAIFRAENLILILPVYYIFFNKSKEAKI